MYKCDENKYLSETLRQYKNVLIKKLEFVYRNSRYRHKKIDWSNTFQGIVSSIIQFIDGATELLPDQQMALVVRR